MRNEKVTCDACEKDLTTRSNMVDYRLVLDSESKPGYGGGAYTAADIIPQIERTHHFCGLSCLAAWLEPQRDYLLKQNERHLKHRAWLAEQDAKQKAPAVSDEGSES